MGRTQADLFARSQRARANAVVAKEQAQAARSSARAIRARLERIGGTAAPCPQRRDLAVMVEDHLPLEEAAERALLLDLTAREIADRLGVPVAYVLRGARERAAYLDTPVEDTLRSWFRALLA